MSRRQHTPLQAWFNEQRERADDDLIYKGASGAQIMWVRDELSALLFAGVPYEYRQTRVWVISEHSSKSVPLPVYSIERPDIGLQVVLRNNFHDWKLSVLSLTPVVCDFSGLFHTTPPIEPKYTGNELAPVYFEGFPPELIFGYYEATDKKHWSAAIGGKETLWATLFLMMRSLGHVKPARWHTRESHAAELLADRTWQNQHMRDKASRWFRRAR